MILAAAIELGEEIVISATRDLINSYITIKELKPKEKQLQKRVQRLTKEMELLRKAGCSTQNEKKERNATLSKLSKLRQAEKIRNETELFFHSSLYYTICNYPGDKMIQMCKDKVAAGCKIIKNSRR